MILIENIIKINHHEFKRNCYLWILSKNIKNEHLSYKYNKIIRGSKHNEI
jgi:hypothetical protein